MQSVLLPQRILSATESAKLSSTTHHYHQGNPLVPGMTQRVLKSISTVLIVASLNVALLPLAQAVQHQRATDAAQNMPISSDELYAQALVQLQKTVQFLSSQTAPTIQGHTDWAAHQISLFEGYAKDMQAQWQALRAKWGKASVTASTLAQQQQLEENFAQRHNQLLALLRPLKTNTPLAADIAALRQFLDQQLPAPLANLVTPSKMPWQTNKAERITPEDDAAQLEKKLQLGQALQPKSAAHPATSTTISTTKALAPASAADLAPTLEAPHTPAITQLAASLGNNPHKIYQWVHDNIYYQPTHGSVQGAQDTLDKKAGNAFDTASLLIALLRASGIPARYVYGTVELPVAQVQNWVGGAQTADAAQQIMGQGGIPNTILTKGGKDFAFRFEHIWVEAQLQYQPGRGARHTPGVSTPDTWVPMDGSYKQYTFQQGMDLQTAVPLDAQALANAATQGATINEAEGWVKNINTTALQSQLSTYQTRLKTHIDSQNAGQSTVGDVLGKRNAVIDPLPYLAGSLPYTIKARTSQFAALPDNLRHQFRYHIYTDARSAVWGDSPILSFQAPTASLTGKKVTLAWVAASAADQAAIQALIPTVAPGQQLDPSQLPTGLPRSIHLKPQILVEGQIKAEGPGMPAGSEPVGAGAFTRYTNWDWDETQDQLIAGQQTALGLSIQGISQAQLQTLQTRMEATKATLEQAQAAPQNQRATILQGMTGDHLTGDLLTATLWGYFASLQSHGAIAASQAHMYDRPALSYGLFHAQVKTNKLFGQVTTGITFQGLNMDIGHLRHNRWVLNDDPSAPINTQAGLATLNNGKTAAHNRWIAYNKMRGQYASAMEHAVPEQFWVDRTQCRYTNEQGQIQNPTKADCAEAVSAVKAIAIAQQQGQRIYTINAQNAATALPALPIGGTVGQEVRAAVQAGKEVTIHESPITAHGWTGYGYSITDPDTGAGAYLIEGRGNGAILLVLGILVGFLITEMLIASAAAIVGSGGLGVGAVLIIDAVILTMLLPLFIVISGILKDANDAQKSCFVGGIFTGVAIASASVGGFVAGLSKPIQAAINGLLQKMGLAGIAGGLLIPATGDYGSCFRA